MNIEDIQVGDWVYSYNTLTGELELKEVTAVFSLVSDHIKYITIVDENGNEQVIETTDGHPFWVVTDDPDLERAAQGMIDENGAILHHNNIAPTEHGFWVEAKDLREGDVFLGANGELSTVVSIERVEYPDGIAVYNLTVDGNHSYFVIAQCDELGQTSILVHNAQYGDEGGGGGEWWQGWVDWWHASGAGNAMGTIINTAASGALFLARMPIAGFLSGPIGPLLASRPAWAKLEEIRIALEPAVRTALENAARRGSALQQVPPQQVQQLCPEQWLNQQWWQWWGGLTPQQQHDHQQWWDGLRPWEQQQIWQDWRERMLRHFPPPAQ